jgi:SRSO17 transposase
MSETWPAWSAMQIALHDDCTGLLLSGEHKSVEPMAALTAPGRTASQHQSLLHFVDQAHWSDQAMLAKVRQVALPPIDAHGAIEAWYDDRAVREPARFLSEVRGKTVETVASPTEILKPLLQ